MIRALFYRGRHFVTTTDATPVLVTELEARAKREEFDRNMAWLRSLTPEQLGALSV